VTGYYDREPSTHIDGTAVFQTPADLAAEAAVAAELEHAWRCKLHQFSELCPIDRYAVKRGRVAGLVEIKVRAHATTTYPTVWLNARKWLALMLTGLGLCCPAVFVVRFTDGIRWIRLGDVDASLVTMGGVDRARRPLALRGDQEPVIDVWVDRMHQLGEDGLL
jgi:hypothetical protein